MGGIIPQDCLRVVRGMVTSVMSILLRDTKFRQTVLASEHLASITDCS